jgi:hypothetical protein
MPVIRGDISRTNKLLWLALLIKKLSNVVSTAMVNSVVVNFKKCTEWEVNELK